MMTVFLLFFLIALTGLSGVAESKQAENQTSIRDYLKECIQNANEDDSFQILIDVVSDPMKSPFYYTGADRQTAFFGKFINGRYFSSDPLVIYESIVLFIAEMENQMNSDKLFVGVVDGDKTYYVNSTSANVLEKPTTTTTTTTTAAPSREIGNSILDAFFNFGNRVAGILVDAAGVNLPSITDDDFWPGKNNTTLRVAKMTQKVLNGRAMGYPIRLPDRANKAPKFTIVITDGSRDVKTYPAPGESVILDIGGYWSLSHRDYSARNVLLIDYPQDLVHFVQICRLMMCQTL